MMKVITDSSILGQVSGGLSVGVSDNDTSVSIERGSLGENGARTFSENGTFASVSGVGESTRFTYLSERSGNTGSVFVSVSASSGE